MQAARSGNGALPPALYVNFLRIAHQRNELFLTFGQLAQDGSSGAHLVASLVASPTHAKSMLRALADAVARYEKRFGEIRLAEPEPPAEAAVGRG